MKKLLLPLLLLALFPRVFADKVEYLPLDAMYEMTETGYLDAPMQTAVGWICTDNRQSTLYLLENGQLRTLVASPGCGRYTCLNADRTKLGFKRIDANGFQAPAVLDLLSGEIELLEPYADQCGQVSFSCDGQTAYTVGKELIIRSKGERRSLPLDCYTNIVRLSPDARMVAYSNADGQPMLLDLTSGTARLLAETTDLYNPRWSADSRLLVFEQGNMTLYTFDVLADTQHCLGKGFGAHWLNNAELVYSRPEYADGDIFFCRGISVCRAKADGSRIEAILPASAECPQETGLMDDGRIAVAYSNGNRRVVLIDPLNPTKEERLCALPAGQQLAFASLPEDRTARHALATDNIGGPVNWEEIPYINQKNDVPPYGETGYAYGPCACAPSTSCMLLGYYGLLDRHPVNSRGSYYSSTDYAWYVGQVYTHPATNFTFNLTHMSSCGGEAAGGYGFMWHDGSPSSKMGRFYTNNNCLGSAYDYSGLPTIRTECNAGFPFSWCITSTRTSGHLILPFRADAAYIRVNGEYVYQQSYGSVVVMDPYGNANNSTWGGSDGRHVTYDCSGYNNGYLQMVNAWGVKVHLSRTPSYVVYHLNGGQFTTDSVTTCYYSDISLPAPQKDNATFQGWFRDQTYSGTRLAVLAPTNDTTHLYALWDDMHLVRYYLNGGSFPDGITPPSVIESSYVLPTPVKRGFDFMGWYWVTDMLGDPVTVLQPGDEGQLWATWTRSTALDEPQTSLAYSGFTVCNPSGLSVSVYNPAGQLILSGNTDLSLESCPAGIYLIRAAGIIFKVRR